MPLNQVLEHPAQFVSTYIATQGHTVGYALLEGPDQGVVVAPQNLHAAGPDGVDEFFEAGSSKRIYPGPRLSLHNDQARRALRPWIDCGTKQAGMPWISTSAHGHLYGNLPHILKTAGMHAMMALAIALSFPAINGTIGRLERIVGAIARRPDYGPYDLSSDRGGHHAGAYCRSGATRGTARCAAGVVGVGCRAGMRHAHLSRYGFAEHNGSRATQCLHD